MKRFSYNERDYTFGKAMLTLRTTMGLTQRDLADLLGISRRAMGDWEAGSSYPKAEHLKRLIALGVQHQAFPAGREAEEIRAFWQAARQKLLLDEEWLAALLSQQLPHLTLVAPLPVEQTHGIDHVLAPPAAGGPRVDWGDALAVPTFYGRERELAALAQWVVEEGCRVVSVLGMGGIGKSALVVSAMHQLAAHFQVVIFRSLRDAPSCETLLESCLQMLAPELLAQLPQSLELRLNLLLEELRRRRVLLVLDNLEVLLAEGEVRGHLRPGFEAYGHLLRRLSETGHQSCLLLTSREKPSALRALEGSRTPVRSLHLGGLDAATCEQLLAEHEVSGSSQERARLVEAYSGNPLALKIVTETIVDLFGGAIDPFLSGGTPIFGGITELLDEQWARLSPLEQTVLSWLAVLREPVTLEDLLAVLVARLAHVQVLEAVDGLRRRSLIERGQRDSSFTLQSVVLEYVTDWLISTASQEIQQGRLLRLREHGLSQAQAKEYVRQTQERLLLAPVLASLQRVYPGRAEMEGRLRTLLDEVRGRPQEAQGYGPANLVALLRVLRGNLRGLDLSRLALRGVFLQGTDMQDTTLSNAVIQDSVFTERFDVSLRVTISSTGAYWVAASRGGEIRVWEEGGLIVRKVWRAHTDMVWALTFSPDGRTLASGSSSGSVKLWDITSGTLLWAAWLTKNITWLAFSPGGGRLASGGLDAIVRLWDPQRGTPLKELPHPSAVCSLAWSPDEKLLASGCSDGSIWLWEPEGPEPDTCVRRLSGHTHWVAGLAFAPDGVLASGSYDGTVKLWDTTSGSCLQTFSGHSDRVIRVVWSPDGRTLASCSVDHTIRLWDDEEGRSRMVLQGHTDVVSNLAFTPDSRTLLSGSNDGTVRVWDVESGQCLRIIGGYAAPLVDIDWSPDGTQLASGGADTLVTLWEGVSMTSHRVLHGHRDIVQGVAWSPDGQLLASGGHDGIGLWDPATGVRLEVLQEPDTANTIFQGVAWSPDGRLLACGSYLRGVQVWDMTTRTRRWVGYTEPTCIRRVAWSPDGTQLVGGGDDGSVYVWDATDGTRLLRLAGHHGVVISVAWSPNGRQLASGGGREDGELFVWEVRSGERHPAWEAGNRALAGHPGAVSAVAWSPSGEVLISGGSDGRLRWWDLHSGECVREREAHQGTVQALKVSPDGSILASCGDDGAITLWDLERGEYLRTLRRDRPYERLDITGIRGLTEAQKATLRALGAREDAPV
jgi:WD40 repeat protein/transcriptional regulator with XRE-family HTH domain